MRNSFEQLCKEHADLRRRHFELAESQKHVEANWRIQHAAIQYALMLEASSDGQKGKKTTYNMRHAYRMARVMVGQPENKLIFRISIPLLRATNFWIWRVVPIPMMINAYLVKVKAINEYLLIDQHNTTYYYVRRAELGACMRDRDDVICELHHPLYKYGADRGRCEMNFIRREVQRSSDCDTQRIATEKIWIICGHKFSLWIILETIRWSERNKILHLDWLERVYWLWQEIVHSTERRCTYRQIELLLEWLLDVLQRL